MGTYLTMETFENIIVTKNAEWGGEIKQGYWDRYVGYWDSVDIHPQGWGFITEDLNIYKCELICMLFDPFNAGDDLPRITKLAENSKIINQLVELNTLRNEIIDDTTFTVTFDQ